MSHPTLDQAIATPVAKPARCVDVGYRGAETKYCAWPAVLQKRFTPAHTTEAGKPGFRLAPIDGGDAQ